MKRLICLVLCLVVACTIYANSSNDGLLKAKTQVVENKIIKLQLTNLQQEKTFVRLESLDKSTTYYRNAIKDHNGFSENLDLNNLPKGRYVLTIKTSGKILQQVLKVEENEVFISEFK